MWGPLILCTLVERVMKGHDEVCTAACGCNTAASATPLLSFLHSHTCKRAKRDVAPMSSPVSMPHYLQHAHTCIMNQSAISRAYICACLCNMIFRVDSNECSDALTCLMDNRCFFIGSHVN